MDWIKHSALILAGMLVVACSGEQSSQEGAGTDTEVDAAAVPATEAAAPKAAMKMGARQALFGDLHIHTQLSFDAFIFGTRSTPDSAYEYAKGAAIDHPSGFKMQLKAPLDFLGVTDHAMYMGMLPAMDDPSTKPGQHPVAMAIRAATNAQERIDAFQGMFPYLRKQLDGPDDLLDPSIVRSAWETTVSAAERHNNPGSFTTFVAYEYTASGAQRENLHRNVVFQGAAPDIPFSSMDSANPEDLWDWLDEQRAQGFEGLAIPHNSNGSDGLMFELAQTDGTAFTKEYAGQRMRNEPLVEITQVKGTSETHPLLSPNDEWADFELMEVKIATVIPSRPKGSYVREALSNGLAFQAEQGFNPYKFGVIGSSDTHVGAGSFDEDNYWSKVGIVDGTPVLRGSVPLPEPGPDGNRYTGGEIASFPAWGASGLAGVWAEENTRDSIYAAFRRKETFGTSGPRMQVRFFAGFDIASAVAAEDRIDQLYANGVPMGGDLLAQGDVAPEFFVWATRDVRSAPLQRLQIVKGWVENGKTQEQVFDVACADGLKVDPATHRCPDNGAKVDLADCSISPDLGAAELEAVWSDPDFDAAQDAFYYVRGLENPTCRWSTWDAMRAGVAPREGLHATIQERVWSSPIWFVPEV